MINIELIRKNKDEIKNKLLNKNFNISIIDEIFNLDIQIRDLKVKIENLNNQKNIISKELGLLYKQNNKIEIDNKQNIVLKIKSDLEQLTIDLEKLENKILELISTVPNPCDDSVPIGKDETQNVVVRTFSFPKKFNFEFLSHADLAKNRNLIDFEKSSKIFGSRFIIYKGNGAKLFRALQQFTLENNISRGYFEIFPPCVLLANNLYNSGQLPKFKADLFSVENDKYYLSPTAEVQLLNMHANEILNEQDFPINYTANTPCFRSEAGAAGKDTKGVIRQHQFWKTELFSFTKPADSWNEHEFMTRTAEMVLEKLNLPYRRIVLCTGDTGFSSAKTYDIEVWLPSYNDYKEISSCSNCLDFQSRRAKIRYKVDNKTIFPHTLNGSSLAIDRLWAAVVENYQQEDGTILIPDALLKYFDNERVI